ncbi:MAG: Lrp/AsnC family transcriptional regulator [Candidatus Anstonellales archaeon]
MLDEKDMRILKMLRENSKTSLKNMAQELGMSETAVKKRVENLKRKGVIRRFTVEINERVVGFAKAIVCLNVSDEKKATALIRKLPFISSLSLSSGSHNLVVEIEGPEGLIPGVFERIKKAKFVKKASCSILVRRL